MSKKTTKKQPTDQPHSPRIINKKARHSYHLLEKLQAGIILEGTEVKSLRQGKASLDEAFCRIRNGELFLLGCTISPYDHAHITNHVPNQPRKLLVHRRELIKIEVKLKQKGLTLIPLRIFFNRGWAKVELAIAQGKTNWDKRDKLKKQQQTRDINQTLRRRR